MINLVADAGNTHTKLAVFNENELLHTARFESLTTAELNAWVEAYQVDRIIISSVKIAVDGWRQVLQPAIPVVVFNRQMAAGIQNHYGTPETLGLDRLAVVIGASKLYPTQNVLVIDGGTCITYDWIDANCNYYGGSISPGLEMRFKALQQYTAALPLVAANAGQQAAFGTDTTTAIRTGVQNGIQYELEGFISAFQEKAGGQLTVLLSGGDSIFFDSVLKNSIFAGSIVHEPYLVLKGLNAAIQDYND
ncbi:type III pantothenate kinase [Mucilaginibacter sp.]